MATSAPTQPLEVPPYQLQLLVDTVIKDFADLIPADADPHNPPAIVRCAQALGKDLYVGCSNGTVVRFALQEHPHRSQPSGYKYVSSLGMPGGKPIVEIALAPTVSKILVQSDARLFFLVYPNMEPVPTSMISPIRMVSTFAVDVGPSDPQLPSLRFAVIKQTGISFFNLRERLFHEKDVNLRSLRLAKRIGCHMLVANAERVYCSIDLNSFAMTPLLPASQDGETIVKPCMAVVGENEFLVCTWMGTGAVGLFFSGDGNPVRGTLQWQQYPDFICVDSPYVAALMPNRSIEVHSLETLAVVQVIPPTEGASVFLEPRIIFGSPHFLAPSSQRIEKLGIVSLPIIPRNEAATKDDSKAAKTSGLTPPPTPSKPGSTEASNIPRSPMHTRSSVLALGSNGLQTLVPTTLISQAESLLENNRLEDLQIMVGQARKRLSTGALIVEDDTAEELRYVNLRIGYILLERTSFEDAGNHLFRGDLDPRLLLRHFPEFAPSPLLVPPEAAVPVYAGIADSITALGSVEDIIAYNLVQNYSPHLKPNTSESPVGKKLKDVLMGNARSMLLTFLRKSRNRRVYDSESQHDPQISKVVDTLLLRLWAEDGDTQEINTLINDAFDTIVFLDVEPTLIKYQLHDVLVRVYEQQQQTGKLLDLLARLVEENWTSELLPDPLSRLLMVLEKAQDRGLLQRWGLWLVRRDAQRGLYVLMAARDLLRRERSIPKSVAEKADTTLLERIREANPRAADQYLEYLVLEKRSTDGSLHTQLAQRYMEEVLTSLADEETRQEVETATSSYLEGSRSVPYLSYIASEMRDSDHKRSRLKLALFLQGSALFDIGVVQAQIGSMRKLLAIEAAILASKRREHRQTLVILATELRDASSAEAYCSLGGIVVAPRLAQSIAERTGLQSWAAMVNGPKPASRRSTRVAPSEQERLNEIREDNNKRDLLKVLMEVYAGSGAEDQTARLLNAQAIHLDVVDVATAIPSSWPIAKLSSFLTRTLRRQMHERHEGMIVKSIAAGQNFEATDTWYTATLAQGALVEEPLPEDEYDDSAGQTADEVKTQFVEQLTEKLATASPEPAADAPYDDLSLS
ncbi:hypothetical protein BKA62DRAFT_713277 [Auriculariales sp. MPI-PUGE-AT-0066]|nr:hypothetical protein BKA62DRAFT_713277 [Auriculariales sp. MPI-PUGE-AT-0066]